jgi:hypothetical protein
MAKRLRHIIFKFNLLMRLCITARLHLQTACDIKNTRFLNSPRQQRCR